MTDSAHPAPPPNGPKGPPGPNGPIPPDHADVREFICSLTHDLRSPLTAARVSAQLIKKNLVEEAKVLNLIGRIITNIDRADHLIEGLLDVNRLLAGQKLQVSIEHCELMSLMKESLIDLQMTYGDRFILISPESLAGYWSPYDLKRVIENLASNAVKYGEKDTLITLRLRDLNHQIQFSVHNTGNPIPPDQQSLLFEPFQRLQSTDHMKQKGWGLGLAIVREITEAHRGSVQLDSSLEAGTTFKITLPKDSR